MVSKDVTAQDIMSSNIVSVSPATSVKTLAKTMADKKISCVLVGKDGIITERDLVRKVLGAGKRPEDLRAKDVMTAHIIGVEKTTPVKEVTDVMKQRKIRHLVVRDQGDVIGLITQTDIVRNTKKMIEVNLTYDRISWIQLVVIIIVAIVVVAIILGK